MNKKIRWIIIGIVAVIIIAISIMAIINEVQLHYKVEEISEYKYFTLEQNQKYGVIDRNGNIVGDPILGGIDNQDNYDSLMQQIQSVIDADSANQ